MAIEPQARLGPVPPIRHATDRHRVDHAARRIWKQLDSTSKHELRARYGTRRTYRFSRPRLLRSRAPYMPRDAYLSLVQSLLETRLEHKRIELMSQTHVGAVAATLEPPPETNAEDLRQVGDQLYERFGPGDVDWAVDILRSILARRWLPFPAAPTEHELAERVRIILLGDWGTGTVRARNLAAMMSQCLVDDPGIEQHVIHLGDVYYSGLPNEYESRFLNDWPVTAGGRAMSWNLNGNHDMYSGGEGYFDVIAVEPRFANQNGTSFFRLHNAHWQIIGLDSAYSDNDLYDDQLPYLERWVGIGGSGVAAPQPKTILLTHHQLGSAHAQESIGPGMRAKTDAVRKTGRVHAWFWGHEHRAFVYEDYLGVACPVCLGNGGVPELLSHMLTIQGVWGYVERAWDRARYWIRTHLQGAQFPPPPTIAWQPPDKYVDSERHTWEPLGFVVIDLDGPKGRATYIPEAGSPHQLHTFGDGPELAPLPTPPGA